MPIIQTKSQKTLYLFNSNDKKLQYYNFFDAI